MEELIRKPSIEPPASERIRETQEQRVHRLARVRLENERQMLVLNFTLSVLSHIKTDTMQEFVRDFRKKPKQILYNLPTGMSFDSVVEVDPTNDKETKAIKTIQVFTEGLVQTVGRLWGQQPSISTESKESQIMRMCEEIEQMGINKNKGLSIIRESFGIQNPEKPESIKPA